MADVDLLVILIEAQFGLLFAASLWRAITRRDVLAWDLTLVFLPIAVIFALAVIANVAGPTPSWAQTGSALLLLAQPMFTLRLVSHIRPIGRWMLPAALAAYLVAAALLVASAGSRQPASTLVAVGVFFVTEGTAAAYLVLEGRHRSGWARGMLLVAAIGTAAIALAILVIGAAGVLGWPTGTVELVTRLLTLAGAVAYGIALLPPRWLRRSFQATQAFAYNEKILASPAAATSEELWDSLATAAAHATHAVIVVLASDGEELRVVASAGTSGPPDIRAAAGALPEVLVDGMHPVTQAVIAATGRRHAIRIPIIVDEAPVGVAYMLRTRPSLFDEGDAEFVAALAGRSANLVQRREALAEQERLSERLRLTVEALSAASAAKSDFLASMSHELRTPLNAIIGFSDLMIAEAGDAATVTVPREWIDHIRSGGTHLVSLINDVLDLAKIEAGRLELNRVPVDLSHVVAESVAGLRPLADRKRQQIRTAVEPTIIDADPGRLRQVLYNLLSNAIKYTGDGGSIEIAASRRDTEVRLSVRDTGVGIAPEHRELVFEEFRQVGNSAVHVEGTGLGLALTRQLIEAHGGRIELESTVGEGSTFTVVLPAAGEVLPAPPAPEAHRPAARAAGRMLVIEDDPSSVRLLQAYLANAGFDVVVAPDGETGLRMARADPPAGILLDILLPRMDGWEVLRQLKSDPAVRDVPVVIVTVVDEREVGLALGAVDYFVKPIDREALIARLERLPITRAAGAVRVLAIDDDPAALTMIDATLTPLGFDVRLATSGHDGLASASLARPDVVICDLLMPGMDGFTVVSRLKDDPATADIPILVVTAHELSELEKRSLTGRVLGVMTKGSLVPEALRDWLAAAVPGVEAAPG